MQVELERINDRLREDDIPVSLLQRGRSLYLQATLPPKPGDTQQRWKQRQIALKLKAGKTGFEQARFKAYRLGEQLARGTFDWDEWIPEEDRPHQPTTIGEWVEKFREDYLARAEGSKTSWERHWQKAYDRLPHDREPSDAYFLAVITSIDPSENGWTRRQVAQKLQKLADFIGMGIDLRPYQGNYGKQKNRKLYIPSDDEILEWYGKIPNPKWQWAYGMMAAYGLRNHEIFFCEFGEEPLSVNVLEGKTGPRSSVMPIYPQWVDRWSLTEIKRPEINCRIEKGYREYGERVTRQFWRYEIPFSPYALRHAYGIRGTIVEGMPESTMAAFMGHSEIVHLSTYNRFAGKAHHMQAYRKNILKES